MKIALAGSRLHSFDCEYTVNLIFSGGWEGCSVLTAGPDDDYESWTVAGPAGVKLVCQPGGEIAVWSAASESD